MTPKSSKTFEGNYQAALNVRQPLPKHQLKLIFNENFQDVTKIWQEKFQVTQLVMNFSGTCQVKLKWILQNMCTLTTGKCNSKKYKTIKPGINYSCLLISGLII